MFISYKIIKKIFAEWVVINIIFFIICSPFIIDRSGPLHVMFFMTPFIVSFLCISAGYSAGYLMKKRPLIMAMPVVLGAILCAATAGSAVCGFISKYFFNPRPYKSGTDFLIKQIEVLVISVTVAALSIIFNYLKTRKDELENDLKDIKNKIKRGASEDSISVKAGEGYCLVKFDSLIYLSSHGKKTTFHTTDKDYTLNELIKNFEEKLPDNFIRIHKQYIINMKYLREIRYYEGGRYTVYLNDEDESVLPVGRNIAPLLKEKSGM